MQNMHKNFLNYYHISIFHEVQIVFIIGTNCLILINLLVHLLFEGYFALFNTINNNKGNIFGVNNNNNTILNCNLCCVTLAFS